MSNRRAVLKATIFAAMVACLVSCSGALPQGSDAVIYLIRHAEKDVSATANKADPVLTQAGHERAQGYVDYFANVKFDRIYSTDYIRTRDTAAPVAAAQDLSVTLYNAAELEGFAQGLKSARGKILIVGHSNTTPALVALLGGDAGSPIDEATEHDRLYEVRIKRDGVAATQRNLDRPGP